MDEFKPTDHALGVFGETLSMCVIWGCLGKTEFPLNYQKLDAFGRLLFSDGSIAGIIGSNKKFDHRGVALTG